MMRFQEAFGRTTHAKPLNFVLLPSLRRFRSADYVPEK
jgi:hypothetical protein